MIQLTNLRNFQQNDSSNFVCLLSLSTVESFQFSCCRLERELSICKQTVKKIVAKL